MCRFETDTIAKFLYPNMFVFGAELGNQKNPLYGLSFGPITGENEAGRKEALR